jgi:hypothetical protein
MYRRRPGVVCSFEVVRWRVADTANKQGTPEALWRIMKQSRLPSCVPLPVIAIGNRFGVDDVVKGGAGLALS